VTDSVFFDTSILIYAMLQPDPRSDLARDLLAQGGSISVQVANECVNVAYRTLRKSWVEIEQALAVIRVLCPSPQSLSIETHDAAVAIADRTGCAFYDALIIASALQRGCTVLFSEGMQHGQVIDGVLHVVNPFRAVGELI